jgi:plasmid rolling circle replication initiator protein Rep
MGKETVDAATSQAAFLRRLGLEIIKIIRFKYLFTIYELIQNLKFETKNNGRNKTILPSNNCKSAVMVRRSPVF